MTTTAINQILNNLYKERGLLVTMSEEQACIYFNVDCKEEASDATEEEISYYEGLLGESEEGSSDDYWSNRGFASEADYNRWRYGA